ncbi:MAG: hypothetical protein IT362_02120 [Deltaproteobacteria bacterium]|nr:hypothetical protein [Deltaproteobacteria bacterium]
MKRYLTALAAGILFAAFTASPINAEVSISIGIGIPPIVLSVPPAVVVIPGTYVYIAPDLQEDVFFYRGYWWRNHQHNWYRAKRLDGRWSHIRRDRTPSALVYLPPGYRDHHPGLDRIENDRVRRDWQKWERERRWDRHAAWKQHKRDRREYREHYREEKRDDRRDSRQERDYRQDDRRDDGKDNRKDNRKGNQHGRDRD